MTNLDYIREIVNSEDAEEKIADFLVDEIACDMFVFDEYICKVCPYKSECLNPCPYSDKDEVKIWLEASK